MNKDRAGNYISIIFIVLLTTALAFYFLNIINRDISIPFTHGRHDDIWQFVLTKVLIQTGWVNTNPFLGAPDVANWHFNPAAQQSPLHSILMLGLSVFTKDAITVQQVYFLLNFPLIALSGYFSCRALGNSRVVSIAVGTLFSFCSYRFNFSIFSFLGNYPAVPPVIALCLLVLSGRFRTTVENARNNALNGGDVFRRVLFSKIFLFGAISCVLVALSDGYYAFFAALLLGFAVFIRVVMGDWRSWQSLAAPVLLLATILFTALALSVPLAIYKRDHPLEFAPNGIPDPSLQRLPMEAEVYAGNLKLLVAPSAEHRIPGLADIGQKVVNTLNASRVFPTGQTAPLGILGSILFALSILMLFVPRKNALNGFNISFPHGLSSLSLFTFLCLTTGGIGPIIALLYPTIRAYDRFGLFLLFIVYLFGASILTMVLTRLNAPRRRLVAAALFILVMISIFDQVGRGVGDVDETGDRIFVAEQAVVTTIEAALPTGAMVYSYPHSQYMEDSRYYGWGAQAQIRLYLHSDSLRWSTGASKNSPVENWHLRTRSMPSAQLRDEIASAGFQAIVVDRTVVEDPEYQHLLAATGLEFTDDPAAKLAYAFLPQPDIRLTYGPEMVPAQLEISQGQLSESTYVPFIVSRVALASYLARDQAGSDVVIDLEAHPELLRSAADMAAEDGSAAIEPDQLVGQMVCLQEPNSQSIKVIITNNGRLAWPLGAGRFPVAVGRHTSSETDQVIEFDDGWRLIFDKTSLVPGESATASMDLQSLNANVGAKRVRLEILQEGVRWYSEIGCTVALP